MAIEKSKKILVALDGSPRSFEAVRYIAAVPLFRQDKVRFSLFTVYNAMPKCYRDLGREPQFGKAFSEVKRWELQKKKKYEAFLQKAKNALIEAGIDSSRVECLLRKKQIGIARDIIKEARSGYDALMIGRKGSGMMKGLNLGSVAAKILAAITDMPLAIVGRHVPVTEKILIPTDGSECAANAVAFAGINLADRQYRIHLFHVIRECKDLDAETEAVLKKEIGAMLDKARDRLIESGISGDLISSEIVAGKRSRAEAILEEAKNQNIGTIVMGRKGISKIGDFFIGRVINKVVQMARFNAVWIIV